MATKEAKELEYEDAPSGYVKFYNYKEPFMPFEGGRGFQGVLLHDGETSKIQCHLCGGWFEALPHHLAREHNVTAPIYKEAVGLRQSTALIGEKLRAKLIASGMEKRMQNLKNSPRKKGSKMPEETRKKISKTLKKISRETQNERGTCPAQLLDRLRNDYHRLGHTPKAKGYGMRHTLAKVFGSYREACRSAGIPVNDGVRTRTKWTRERCVLELWKYYDEHGKLPMRKEAKSLWNAVYKKKWDKNKLVADALAYDGKYRKQSRVVRYSDEQLLNFLRNFEEINGRKPSYSDCKRGLLPHLSRYSYRFGSWKNALKLAF